MLRDGRLVMATGYGLANVGLGVPVHVATIFQSRSIGKQFTAAAVMLLVEEGKLGLDDPIGKYLDRAPEAWNMHPYGFGWALGKANGYPVVVFANLAGHDPARLAHRIAELSEPALAPPE
jgi:hypothetical protein